MLYGSPNYCTESSACDTAAGMAWRSIYGQGTAPDLANTKCVFALGRNPFHANTTMSRHLLDARERGTKFIVADPRVTPLASMADIHLQLRPGTDGALALAMANVIISEGLYDREFVSEWTRGFDEFRSYAAEFTVERAEEITGVPATKIRDAALLYATSKPAAMMPSSSPVVHHVNGVQYERAMLVLVGLTGNFDIPGETSPFPQAGCTWQAPGSSPGSTSSRCPGRGASCRLVSGRPASRYGRRWWTNASRWTSPDRWPPGSPTHCGD